MLLLLLAACSGVYDKSTETAKPPHSDVVESDTGAPCEHALTGGSVYERNVGDGTTGTWYEGWTLCFEPDAGGPSGTVSGEVRWGWWTGEVYTDMAGTYEVGDACSSGCDYELRLDLDAPAVWYIQDNSLWYWAEDAVSAERLYLSWYDLIPVE